VSRRLLAVLALCLLLAGCRDMRLGDRLTIDVDASQPGVCPAAEQRDLRLERDGTAARFVDARTNLAVRVVWPFGFAAWLVDGQAIVYASDGTTVMLEDGPAVTIGGTQLEADGPFRVCSVGLRTYG
jgi:hypothetical protein